MRQLLELLAPRPPGGPRNLVPLAVGVLVLWALVVCCGLGILIQRTITSGPGGAAAAQTTATTTANQLQPGGSLAATATHAAATTGPTVLGAPGAAFIAKYGPLVASQSNPSQGDLHFRQYPGVAQDYLIVDLASHYGETPANDAASIVVAPHRASHGP